MPQISADQIRWDLTSLYADLDDEKLQADLGAAHQQAEQFRDDFHGKIDRPEINPASFSKALKEYEALQLIVLKPYLFAQLLFYSESGNPEHTSLVARVREAWQAIHELTLFFELEILALEEDVYQALLQYLSVAPFAHYLSTVRAHAAYTQS